MKPVLVVMVGLPGSGKTTVAQRIVDLIRRERSACMVFCSDTQIEKIAVAKGMRYQDVFCDEVGSASRAMWMDLKRAVKRGDSIIQDRVNHRRGTRARVLATVGSEYFRVAAVMPTPTPIAQQRNGKRGDRSVPEGVFRTMKGEYEAPRLDEGFDALICPAKMKWDGLSGCLAAYFWDHIKEAQASKLGG